jgi:cyclase
MNRALVLLTLLLAGGAAMSLAARQAEPRIVRMQTLNVSDNLYLLSGGGGHTLALATDTGVILIDTKLAGWGQPLLDAIAAVTDQPVTTIINTHSHGDHTGSNSEFASVLEIVAHENTKANMAKMDAFQNERARHLPNRTYGDRLSLLEGIDRIDLYYFGPGHTNGDTVVVFPAKRVAHLGDLFPSKAAPFIDAANGGSGVAYPDTLARAVAALDPNTRIVTGHGTPPPGSPIRGLPTLKDLQEYADFTREFLNAVRAARDAGQSAAEAATSLRLPDRYRGYGMDRAAANVAAIYQELQR